MITSRSKVMASTSAFSLLPPSRSLFSSSPASAVEQCRFIQAKPEREACYQRQEAELAAKRKPAESRRDPTMEALQQMKHDDEALDRQIHSICRGC